VEFATLPRLPRSISAFYTREAVAAEPCARIEKTAWQIKNVAIEYKLLIY
jgi:hypothetical protein